MDKKEFLEVVPELKKWALKRPIWLRSLGAVFLILLGSVPVFREAASAFLTKLLNPASITMPVLGWIAVVSIFIYFSVVGAAWFNRKKLIYRAFAIAWREYAQNLWMIQLYWESAHENPNVSKDKKEKYDQMFHDHAVQGHVLREKVTYLLSVIDRFSDDFNYFDRMWKTYAESRPKIKSVYPTPFHFLTDRVNPVPLVVHLFDEWREAEYICGKYVEEMENRISSKSQRFKQIEKRSADMKKNNQKVLHELSTTAAFE